MHQKMTVRLVRHEFEPEFENESRDYTAQSDTHDVVIVLENWSDGEDGIEHGEPTLLRISLEGENSNVFTVQVENGDAVMIAPQSPKSFKVMVT